MCLSVPKSSSLSMSVCGLFGGFNGSPLTAMYIKESKLPIQQQYGVALTPPALTPPPVPPVRRESYSQRYASSTPGLAAASTSSSSSSSTHISFTRKITRGAATPEALPLPSRIPPRLTQVEVSPATSMETFRADLATREGSILLPSTDSDLYDPLISGEFVLVRQTIDDSNAPRVQEDTEMVIPVPLHGTSGIPAPLIGPGVCRVTTESRQQALLDGHFRLRRAPINPNRRKLSNEPEVMTPPEPPKRTTSLLHSGSSSTLASIGERVKQSEREREACVT